MEKIDTFSDYLSFRGMRVHYRVIRPRETEIRRRVLLLNAPLTTAFNWRLLMPELLSHDSMVAQIDLPGYGLSDCGKGVPQDPATRAQIVWGVLDEIDTSLSYVSQYWHLISHGSSCLTTLTMAQQAPECVASNVFISPLLHAPMSRLYRRFIGGRMLENAAEKWYFDSVMNEDGLRRQLSEWFGRQVPDHVFTPMRKSLIRPGMKQQLIRLIREGFTYDPEIFHSFTPMMAIWGPQDPLFTAADAAEFRRLAPDVETHVLQTGAHFPQETHSRAVCDYLRGWLRFIDEG